MLGSFNLSSPLCVRALTIHQWIPLANLESVNNQERIHQSLWPAQKILYLQIQDHTEPVKRCAPSVTNMNCVLFRYNLLTA